MACIPRAFHFKIVELQNSHVFLAEEKKISAVLSICQVRRWLRTPNELNELEHRGAKAGIADLRRLISIS